MNELQERVAQRLGKEAAVWTPTCSVANLAALLTQGDRGTYLATDAEAHVLTSEGMGLFAVGGLTPLPVHGDGGALVPSALEAAFEQVTRVGGRAQRLSIVCLENTHTRSGGTVLTPMQTAELAAIAHRHGAAVHLDGARLFNAAVALGIEPAQLADPVDTVSVSLNKGLSAPFGALLCGSRDVIARARSHLRELGAASVHKAGLAAAAGIVAIDTMVSRLAEDHRRAQELAQRIDGEAGLRVDPRRIQTNIVLVDVSATAQACQMFASRLRKAGVLCLVRDDRRIRLVTHRLVGDSEVAQAADAFVSVATDSS